MLESGINSKGVLVECIKEFSFILGEIDRVFEGLNKGFLVSSVWSSILENLGAIGVCLEELLSSLEFREVAGAERK